MTLRKKVFVFAGVSFLVLLVTLIVAIPFLVDVDRHRPRIAAFIEEQTGKPTTIGRLTLTIFPTTSIRVDDFVLGNPEGFPEGDFFRSRRIYAELDRGALRRRQVVIRSLEIDDPVISLLSTAQGKWNFENPPSPAAPASQATAEGESEPAFTLGVIERVSITGGQVAAAKLVSPAEAAPSYFEAANLATELVQVNLNAFTSAGSASLSPAPALPNPVIPRNEVTRDPAPRPFCLPFPLPTPYFLSSSLRQRLPPRFRHKRHRAQRHQIIAAEELLPALPSFLRCHPSPPGVIPRRETIPRCGIVSDEGPALLSAIPCSLEYYRTLLDTHSSTLLP